MFDFLKRNKKPEVHTEIAPFESLHSAVIFIDATDPDWGQARIKTSIFFKVYGIKGENWYFNLEKRDKDDPLETPIDKSILREDVKWRRGEPASDRLSTLVNEEPDILISLIGEKNPQIERIFKESHARFKVARQLSDSHVADILIEDGPDKKCSQEESLDIIVKWLKKIQ